jgi:hypothetical protein
VPEKALPGVVTNTAQPIVVTGRPATEQESARAGVVTESGVSVTVVGAPAVE